MQWAADRLQGPCIGTSSVVKRSSDHMLLCGVLLSLTIRDPSRIAISKTSLEVREDPMAGTHVPNLLYVDVQNSRQVLQLVAAGNCNRATAHTGMVGAQPGAVAACMLDYCYVSWGWCYVHRCFCCSAGKVLTLF